MNRKRIFDIFTATECLCGRKKRTRMSHCPPCYHQLPPEKKKALYKRFGEGYEEAYLDSVEFLELDTEEGALAA